MSDEGFGVRPRGAAAHHIVPHDDARYPSAVRAREIFNSFDVELNDAVNGVYLPISERAVNEAASEGRMLVGALHGKLHGRSEDYYDIVVQRLDALDPTATKDDLIDVLDSIRDDLLNDRMFD